MRTLTSRSILPAIASAVALVACEQILGFPDDTVAGTGGAGTSSSASSAGSTTSSSSAGSGGTGGGGCAAGATRPCYDGPAGTEGVGACKGGTQTCDGTSWGACAGAVPPAVEDCTTTTVDESCDGLPACGGAYRWARGYGDALGQYGYGAAVDAAGNLVVVGRVNGVTDFGGGPLTAAGTDVFVAVLDAQGDHVWSKIYGDAAPQVAVGVATDASRNIIVVGTLAGSIDFGTGALTSPQGTNGFVVKLDPAGAELWGKELGDTELQVNGVGVDAAGDVLVAGTYQGTPDLGTGPLPAAPKSRAYVAKLDHGDGHPLWILPFGANVATDAHNTTALAVDGNGDLVVSLTYSGSVVPPSSPAVCATQGGVVYKLGGADGAVKWAWATCDPVAGSNHAPGALAVNGAGDVLVAGGFNGTIDLGVGGPRPSAGSVDAFWVKLDHTSGAPQVGAVYGSVSVQRVMSVVFDAAGNFALAGNSVGNIDLGGGPLGISGNGAFLAKYSGAGGYLWGRAFSAGTSTIDADTAYGFGYRGLAAFPTGALAWATGFGSSVDLGGGSLISQGAADVLIAVVAP